VAEIAKQEQESLLLAKKTLWEDHIAVGEMSVGSTPTVLACDSYAKEITELRPGRQRIEFQVTIKEIMYLWIGHH
jgi:UDP-N-acetylglucosamine enolpyruvyl transferase